MNLNLNIPLFNLNSNPCYALIYIVIDSHNWDSITNLSQHYF